MSNVTSIIKPQFIWSDTWLLMSISLADQNVGASLSELISIGDYINHAIFTGPELRCGLAKLIYLGYIVEKESHFFLDGQAKEFWENRKKSRMSLSKRQAACEKFLNAEPYSVQPHFDDPNWQYPGITDEIIKKAYEEYLGKLQKNKK